MNKKIIIIDYGVGNIHSLVYAFKYLGEKVEITSDIKKIKNSSHIILPGVGSFGYAINQLKKLDIFNTLKAIDSGKKILCICLGMQLLFNSSSEDENQEGLGLVDGKVISLKNIDKKERVPIIGWREVKSYYNSNNKKNNFAKLIEKKKFYHLHSFYCQPTDEDIICNYIDFGEKKIPVALKKNNIYGVQFHPEKSREQGLHVLEDFGKK